MASLGPDLGDGLDFSNNRDVDVQFIEAPKIDQPRFITLVRDAQKMPVNPVIPSWLSNSISKKRSLQPVLTLVKEIATRYIARGSKTKKTKIDAHLIKDPQTRKIATEVATYKQKQESGDIDEEGFKVTSIELGTINRSIDDKFFKLSANHMLTQLEKDSKEQKELKGMITTMATYIDSLNNLEAAPVIQVHNLLILTLLKANS